MASPSALAGLKPKITKKALIDAAYSCGGIVSLVAERFGVSRVAIHKHLKQSSELQEVFEQASESLLDLAEAKHIEAIREGYYPAILFHLKTKGRKRGYSATDPIPLDENDRGFILKIEEAKRPDALSEVMEIYEQAIKENPLSDTINKQS